METMEKIDETTLNEAKEMSWRLHGVAVYYMYKKLAPKLETAPNGNALLDVCEDMKIEFVKQMLSNLKSCGKSLDDGLSLFSKAEDFETYKTYLDNTYMWSSEDMLSDPYLAARKFIEFVFESECDKYLYDRDIPTVYDAYSKGM